MFGELDPGSMGDSVSNVCYCGGDALDNGSCYPSTPNKYSSCSSWLHYVSVMKQIVRLHRFSIESIITLCTNLLIIEFVPQWGQIPDPRIHLRPLPNPPGKNNNTAIESTWGLPKSMEKILR
ncbi:unnamed protein product [Ilex paraguariensis]|uniref:Uncharacterized protein n=1 Tax=Ilex paraguariensis TaxID=185542 RepID=A0ABC8T456_9AQUA